MTSGASWSPSYDLRVDTQTDSVSCTYFGMVTQSTSEDWRGTKRSEIWLMAITASACTDAPVVRTMGPITPLHGCELRRRCVGSSDKSALKQAIVHSRGLMPAISYALVGVSAANNRLSGQPHSTRNASSLAHASLLTYVRTPGVSLRLSTAEPTVHGTPPVLGSKTVSIKTVQKPVHSYNNPQRSMVRRSRLRHGSPGITKRTSSSLKE